MANTIQNKVATTSNGDKKTMQQYIKSMEGEIAKALPTVITPERFTRMVLSAISVNPKLASCTPKSFLGAMMQAAQLGLEPNTPLGQAYLIPFKNHGVDEVQFQIGYKGLIQLADRSRVLVEAHEVRENDEFEYCYGLEPKLVYRPALKNRGELICFYAMFRTETGGFGFEIMSVEDIKAHATKYSQSSNSSYSPWKTAFEEMAKKTVIRKLLKYAPLKTEFVRAVASDGSVKSVLSDDMLDVPNEIFIDDADIVTVDEETGEVSENA